MTMEVPFPKLTVTVTSTGLITPQYQEEVTCTLPWSLSQPVAHREYVIVVRGATIPTSSVKDHCNDDDDTTTTTTTTTTTIILCKIQLRFSEFYKRFSKDQRLCNIGPASSLLPSRGFLFFLDNYTTNEVNVKSRARQMEAYLYCLLNQCEPSILEYPILQQALDIHSKQGKDILSQIAKRRRDIEDQQKEMRRKQAEQVIQAQQEVRRKQVAQEKSHWEQARAFKVTNPESLSLSSSSFSSSLSFPVSYTFQIQPKWFSAGDATIHGGTLNKRLWFRLVRTDYPQILPFSDVTYQICTVNGEPLLELKERFRMMDYLCDIYYVVTTATAASGASGGTTTHTKQHRVGALKVHRKVQLGWLEEKYTITSIGTTIQDKKYDCSGSISNSHLRINGTAAARLVKDFFGLNHTVTISPNQDCLLLLGISCAVTRIRAAIAASHS